jgi:hypothetical protein
MARMSVIALFFACALLVSTSEGARVGMGQLFHYHPIPSHPKYPPLRPPPDSAPMSLPNPIAFAPEELLAHRIKPPRSFPGPCNPIC